MSEATYRCPKCGTEYTADGICGQNRPFECRERLVLIDSSRYDWSEDPTAQDVIDALRVALLAQDDPAKVDRLVRELVEFAPETESTRGMDLIMRLLSEATLRLDWNLSEAREQQTGGDHA